MAGSTSRLDLPVSSWQRVSPKYVMVELTSSVIGALIACAVSVPFALSGQWWGYLALAAAISLGLALIILAPRRARAIGYQLRDNDLLFRRGIMFQRFVAVPYGRMQLIDINRGPLGRMLGLADLKFVTAAAATDVTLPGLVAGDADALRDRLVELAESRRSGL